MRRLPGYNIKEKFVIETLVGDSYNQSGQRYYQQRAENLFRDIRRWSSMSLSIDQSASRQNGGDPRSRVCEELHTVCIVYDDYTKKPIHVYSIYSIYSIYNIYSKILIHVGCLDIIHLCVMHVLLYMNCTVHV